MWEVNRIDNGRAVAFLPEGEGPRVKGVYFGVEDKADGLKGVVGVIRRCWHTSEIRHLYVDPDFRRRGIARALVRRAFRGTLAPRAIATVREDNRPSIGAFLANGFEEIDRFMNPETGHAVVVLRKTKRGAREVADEEAR